MARLGELPLDLLHSISSYLVNVEEDTGAIFSFALTCRACSVASEPFQFCHASLVAGAEQSEQELGGAVAALDHMLGNRASHVRCFEIKAPVSLGPEPFDPFALDVAHDFFWVANTIDYPRGTSQDAQSWATRWLPLVVLIQRMTRLADLKWISPHQVPPSILGTIAEQHPTCRLHVYTFDIRSLHQLPDSGADGETVLPADSDEYRLIASTALHSIVLPHVFWYDSFGCWDYNIENAMGMVSGESLSLQHVRIFQVVPGNSIYQQRLGNSIRGTWQPLNMKPQESRSPRHAHGKGSLKTLCLGGTTSYSTEQLRKWFDCTHASALAHLDLCCSGQALAYLTEMAQNGDFKSLSALGLTLADHAEPGCDMTRVCEMVSHLPPVQHLRICGSRFLGNLANVINEHHGITLTELYLDDRLLVDGATIHSLAQGCRQIRQLTIGIRRSQGDYSEACAYRALGKLPLLENASLVLDCSQSQASRPNLDGSLDTAEKEITLRNVRESLINAAIDHRLAQSILRVISVSQEASRASNGFTSAPQFRCLKIRPRGLGEFKDRERCADLRLILSWIGRTWKCSRGATSSWRLETGTRTVTDSFYVEELDKRNRQFNAEFLEDDLEYADNDGLIDEAWRTLWPYTGSDWKESWNSSPLSNE